VKGIKMSKYNELKKQLINAAFTAEKHGLCRHKSGNFSICMRDESLILITPTGLDRSSLTSDDIVICDFDENILENINNTKPSIELSMHIAIYKERVNINAIAHTHSIYATAFAVKGIKIKPVVTEAAFYGNNVELVEFASPGSLELAENIKEPIKKADVCLLKNHGVVTVASTIERALMKALYVEDVAQISAISEYLKA
jgi:L-fuculose-phosphate aldolase